MRIGILKLADPEKGLAKCSDTLAWALRRHHTDVLPVRRFASLHRAPDERFWRWARTLDVFVSVEQFLPHVTRQLCSEGIRVVLVPNLDWAAPFDGGGVRQWVENVRESGVEVWSRTVCTRACLNAVGIASLAVGWSIADPVRTHRPPPGASRDFVFLMNAGRGGWSRRRGADIALHAFEILHGRRPNVRFILTTLRPLDQIADDAPLNSRVTVLEGWQPLARLAALRLQANAVIHPSRWEGLGYPMLEALHDGLPVVATDGWPMNEFVSHERTGLLVPARQAGRMRLAPHWECEPEALADAMQRLVDDPDLCARVTCATPGAWRDAQRAFPRALERALSRQDHRGLDVQEDAGGPVR